MSAAYRMLAGFRSPVCTLPYTHQNLDRIHDVFSLEQRVSLEQPHRT